jgi:hypothetical protein
MNISLGYEEKTWNLSYFGLRLLLAKGLLHASRLLGPGRH